MPAAEPLVGTRIVAEPRAIDRAVWPAGCRVLRIAPDDVLVLGETAASVDDPHAIVEPESMFAGMWLDRPVVAEWVACNAEWTFPHEDGLSQGMVAGLPVKILGEGGRALVIVPTSLAAELEERL